MTNFPLEHDKDGESPNQTGAKLISRRNLLLTLAVGINAVAATLFAIPVIGYITGPSRRKEADSALSWTSLGELDQFPIGETRLAKYRNPFVRPWDGDTGDIPCWVRRISADKLQIFAVNCAHLGCPVRWFPQSQLFLCPCHGGAYYADGARASGPPPRGLFEYEYKIEGSVLLIKSGQIPTLSQPPSGTSAGKPPKRSCA